MDGVKSWLSKSKGSAKNLSDDGSLKSSRSVEARAVEPSWAKMADGSFVLPAVRKKTYFSRREPPP